MSLLPCVHVQLRGTAIGSIVVVDDTKIAKSGDLDTWASCKHNSESVKFGENWLHNMLLLISSNHIHTGINGRTNSKDQAEYLYI